MQVRYQAAPRSDPGLGTAESAVWGAKEDSPGPGQGKAQGEIGDPPPLGVGRAEG